MLTEWVTLDSRISAIVFVIVELENSMLNVPP